MSDVNHQIVLAERPQGTVEPSCFEHTSTPIPEPGPGEALLRVRYLSIDPTIRGWMQHETYLPAITIGETIRSAGLGEVVTSNSDAYQVGDLVFGLTGWQEYCLIGGAAGPMQVLPAGIDPIDAISVYGVTGITAYVGLLDIGKTVAGDTVLVSGAAGATGSVAGQIAKLTGCRVVGIAGTDEKCAWIVDELGFDAAINYRTEDVHARIGETCSDGVDVFFDNVGGDILEAALGHLAMRGRIVLCGSIATYNDEELRPGPRGIGNLIVKRGRMEGFIVLDHAARFPEIALQIAVWVEEGKIKNRVDLVEGLDQAPEALNKLFTGGNTGKLVVAI